MTLNDLRTIAARHGVQVLVNTCRDVDGIETDYVVLACPQSGRSEMTSFPVGRVRAQTAADWMADELAARWGWA